LLGAITVAVLAFFFQRHAAALNAMALGEAEARYLGIDVEKLKLLLIVLSAIGVGVAVAAAGIIGFVGLVMPHAVRLLSGPDHRSLLPLSALAGALLLACADLFARTQVAPAELPVGLVTTLLGAPFFLSLLLRQRSKPDGV
jgi:iron complex transport system permease protein